MYNSTLEVFENDNNYCDLLEILYEYGDSHEDMHNCYQKALNLVKGFGLLNFSENERKVKEAIFDILEGIVLEQVEDYIKHRWEFDEFSTFEFLELLSDPIEALACTHQLFLEPEDDQETDDIGEYRLIH